MIFLYLLLSLLITLIIEIPIAYLNKISVKYALMVNVVTNPMAVIIYYWSIYLQFNSTVTIILIEILVVLAEWLLYKNLHKKPFLLSVIINAISFGIGFLLQLILN